MHCPDECAQIFIMTGKIKFMQQASLLRYRQGETSAPRDRTCAAPSGERLPGNPPPRIAQQTCHNDRSGRV